MAHRGVATLTGVFLLITMLFATTTISQSQIGYEAENTIESTFEENIESPATGRGNSDLIIDYISASWSSADAGDSKSVSVRLENQGTASSGSFYWGIYLSTDSTITTNDIELDTYYKSSMTSGSTTSTFYKTVTIPTTINGARYYVGALADINTQVSETNENNNDDYDTGRVTIYEAPDLTGRSCSAPSTGVVGDYLDSSISLSIENDPGGSYIDSSGTFYWAMYLSSDSTITTSDEQVGSDQYKSSISGGSYSSDSLSTSNRIPSNINPGTYYWGFIVDVRTDVVEQSETNNAYTCTTQIVIEDDIPDLFADNVGTSSSSAIMGDTISVSYRIDNDGHDYSGSFYWKLYLSIDSTITSSDILVDEFSQSSISSGSYTSSTKYNVQIPTGINSGYYYLGMIVDNRGTITELDETNNAVADNSRINIEEPADLEPSSPSGPSSAFTGDTVSMNWRINNIGDDSSGYFYWKAYLSTDATITSGDTLLGSSNYASSITGGSYRTGQLSVTIPSGLSSGTYYWGIIVDTSNYVSEGDELNNAEAGSTITLTVASPDLRADSISVDSTTSTICLEDTVTVNIDVSNIGNSNAGSHYYEVLFSKTAQSGSWISIGHANGGTTTTYQQQVSGTIPASMTAGDYYTRIFVDSTNIISEPDEANNYFDTLTKELTVQDCTPNLVPSSLSGPASVLPGQTVTLQYALENSGLGSASNFPVDFFLSANPTIDTSDTFLGAENINTISPSSTISDSIDVTIPSNVGSGCWYYGIIIDMNDVITEINENDNSFSGANQVCIMQANLRVVSVSNPGPSILGQTIQVSVNVENVGNANAGAHELAFIAEITESGEISEYVLEIYNVPSISSGSTLEVTRTFPLPSTPAGTYRIIATIDYSGQIYESDETDNVGYGTNFEVTSPGNDLLAKWITGPTTAEIGQTITLQWELENLGENENAFATQIWFSRDTILDPQDLLIHQYSIGQLDGQTARQDTHTLQVTEETNGSWRVFLKVDSADQHEEDNEQNNIVISSNTLTVSDSDPIPNDGPLVGCNDPSTDGDETTDAAGTRASATHLGMDVESLTLEGCLISIDNEDWFSILVHGGKRVGISLETAGEVISIQLFNGTVMEDNGTVKIGEERANLQIQNEDETDSSRIYHIRIFKTSSDNGGAYTLKLLTVDLDEQPDLEPPSKPELPNLDEWIGGEEIELSWQNVTDTGGSELSHYQIRWASGLWLDINSTSTTLNISSFADGRHSLELRAVDNAGNPSPSDAKWVRIDRQAPTISVTQLSAQYAGPPVLHVSIVMNDGEGSGISLVEWSWDNQTWQNYPSSGAIIWSNWSDIDLYVRATDNVGLSSITNMTINPPTTPNEPTDGEKTDSSSTSGGTTATGVVTIVLIILALAGLAVMGVYLIFRVNAPGEDDEFDEEDDQDGNDSGHHEISQGSVGYSTEEAVLPTAEKISMSVETPPTPFEETLIVEVQSVSNHEYLPPGGTYDTSTGVTWYLQTDGTRWWMQDDGSFSLDQTSLPTHTDE